ncbi:MAG: putative sulfate/molybdate transporter [Planctomycetota bacterium]
MSATGAAADRAGETVVARRPWLAFNAREFAGGLGDLGTFLPLTIGVSLACGLDLGMVVLLAGLMNILTGVMFGQPIPVQPMKAIAAIAIAEGLTAGEIRWAGLWMAGLLVAIACVPEFNRWVTRMPRSWIAALQAGIAAKLALLGVVMIAQLPVAGVDGSVMAVLLLAALGAGAVRHVWLLPLVVGIGGAYALGVGAGGGEASATGETLAGDVPGAGSAMAGVWSGLVTLALPQLPLTLLNSVVAVCALSAAYFPGQGVPPRRMAVSVGLMNAVTSPLGGMPMCHGAGGLAAQHYFGARTGGSVVMLGLLKIAVVLALWPRLGDVLTHFPLAVLAPLLVIAGARLAGAAAPAWRGIDRWLIAGGALAILTLGTLVGFGLVLVAWLALGLFRRSGERARSGVDAVRSG